MLTDTAMITVVMAIYLLTVKKENKSLNSSIVILGWNPFYLLEGIEL